MPGQQFQLTQFSAARERIGSAVLRTPMVPSPSLSERTGVPVFLKMEHHQTTGSFKLRGATNALLQLDEDTRRRGVVCVSTGNHGRALAFASKRLGVDCTICMSKLVPQNKVEAIRELGAQIVITGASQDEAQLEADRLVAENGLTLVPPFDHHDVICGQGTLGLEIMEDVPDAHTILVPLSGGGLIAGVAAAAKETNPAVKIIGLSMERGAAMAASLKAGRPVQVTEEPSLADSLGGGIGLQNQYTFQIARDLVDQVILLPETEIAEGIRHAYWQERQVIEGGAAVGIAALLNGDLKPEGPVVMLLSGCNIDMSLHHRIIGGENVDLAEETKG
ncbi:hydroxyectoine utilization dehydratase EutB [Roseibium denhamense]|uniref:Threonine dehydratase n=1 Tax=Roseibium denhamense TaxID=76305 RepID=A0ABY1PJG3_9HYPH|nr:hydroxyectoine utilization dehydratase EutB [Roseibium denhamense]SMP35445.1 threonine dehydratase [Roseibium denhamense]